MALRDVMVGAAILGLKTSGSSISSGSPGVTYVPNATGDATNDTAAINAAIAAAGTGGIVEFPPGQTYRIKNFAGSIAVLPALIRGNGSTLKLADAVSTTIASGTVTAASTTVTVANASVFSVGDAVTMTDAAGTYAYPASITGISSNVLTIDGVAFAAGTSLTTGATVMRNDICMYFHNATSSISMEITGLQFDGNSANRTAARNWTNQQLFKMSAATSVVNSRIWLHHNIFKNGPCDGIALNDVPGVDIHDNLLFNIFGNGVHPGGSGYTVDLHIGNNLLVNVHQATDVSAPTATIYGHTDQAGALVTSVGPHRMVVTGNIIETSTGYGFAGWLNSTNTRMVLSNNIIRNCVRGGFKVAIGGKYASIVGNIIDTCGHDTSHISNYYEVTQVQSAPESMANITGNAFINSCVVLNGDNASALIHDNIFDYLTKAAGANIEFAALFATYASTGQTGVSIKNNLFRGPESAAESTAVSDAPLYAMRVNGGTGITVSGNIMRGGRHALWLTTANAKTCNGFSFSGNNCFNQFSASGTNSAAIRVSGASGAFNGLQINQNVFGLYLTATTAWSGVRFEDANDVFKASQICGNIFLATGATPTSQIGVTLASTGTGLMIAGNSFNLGRAASGVAISAAAATSGCLITNNHMQNSNTISVNTATVTAGNLSI